MLIRKMFRDLRHHFGQFFSIFMLAFLASNMFTGIQGEVESVVAGRKGYEEQINLADGWIYGDDFSKQNEEDIAALNEIQNVERRYYLKTKDENNSNMYMYFQDESVVSKPLVLEGEEYNIDDPEGLWLCSRFAQEQDIKLGTSYSFTDDKGEKYTFKVKGFVWSPEYEYYKDDVDTQPDYKKNGYGFASIKAVPDHERKYNQIVFTSEKVDQGQIKISALEEEISSVLNGNYSVLIGRDGITNITMLDDEINQHKGMALMMPAFFITIAILTTVTTMKRIVDRQRTQIGTLKAIGRKKSKIYMHYLGYGLYPSFIGAVLGVIIGPLTMAPSLFKMKYFLDTSTEYMLPHFKVVYPAYFFLVALAITGICTIAAWLSVKNILKIAPAAALRPAQPKSSKATVFEKLPFWNSLSFSVRYNLRDISKNKARTILGVVGTTFCMALLLMGFASRNDFSNAIYDLYIKDLMDNANMITMNQDVSLNEAEELRDSVHGELIMSDTTEIRLPESSDKYSFHMNVYEDSRIANALDMDFKPEKITSDDFTLTVKAAEKLGVKVGDTIEWHIYGFPNWTKSTVTKITRAPFEQGIVAGREAVEKAGFSFTPTRLITKDEITDEIKDNPHINSVIITSKADEEFGDSLELVNMVMGFSLICGLFLAVTVLYCLGLLTFEERLKEMAVLKVLGLSSRKLKGLMLQQNIILSVIGSLLGIPLGSWMLKFLMYSLGDSMDIPANFSFKYAVISFIITVGVSMAVNLLFSKRIRKMNMVEETKSAE